MAYGELQRARFATMREQTEATASKQLAKGKAAADAANVSRSASMALALSSQDTFDKWWSVINGRVLWGVTMGLLAAASDAGRNCARLVLDVNEAVEAPPTKVTPESALWYQRLLDLRKVKGSYKPPKNHCFGAATISVDEELRPALQQRLARLRATQDAVVSRE